MGPIKPIHGVWSLVKTVLIFAKFNIKTDDRNSEDISNSINLSVALSARDVKYQASDST